MRKIAFLLFAFSLIACEEKDLTEENPAPPPENVNIKTSFVYDGKGFSKDTAITNEQGLSFFIEDIKIVFSDFFFKELDDTVIHEAEPFVITTKETDKALVELEPGGYSGTFGLRVGLDSAAQIEVAANGIPNDSELKDYNFLRSDNNGIDNVVITGRLIDPLNPLDSTGSISLEYRLGTAATSRLKTSLQKNFSIERNSNFNLILLVDIEPIFNDLDMEARPIVETDPKNLVDYELALEMADSLGVEIF